MRPSCCRGVRIYRGRIDLGGMAIVRTCGRRDFGGGAGRALCDDGRSILQGRGAGVEGTNDDVVGAAVRHSEGSRDRDGNDGNEQQWCRLCDWNAGVPLHCVGSCDGDNADVRNGAWRNGGDGSWGWFR